MMIGLVNGLPSTSSTATINSFKGRSIFPNILDISPDLDSISIFANCTEEQKETIYGYDSSKLTLVDSTLPILCIILSIFSLSINILFVFLVIRGLYEKKLPFKGYSLLINRSVTDILTSFLTLIFVSLHKLVFIQGNPEYPADERNTTVYEMDYLIPHGRTMFTLLLTANFWSAAGAYAVLALFTYFAIRHPWFYMAKITARRTVYVMLGVWAVGAVYSIIVVCISANNAFNVFNDAKDLIRWNVSSEDYVLSIFNLFIVLVSFLIVTISYAAIMVYLYRKSQDSGNASLHLMSIGRLALNIFAFSITCIVMAGFVSIPIILKTHIDYLIDEIQESQCKTLVAAYQLSYQMAEWTTAAMVGWLLRMIMDPLANLLLDTRFKLIYGHWCRWIDMTPRRTTTRVATDFLRKCAEANIMPVSIISSEGKYFRFRSPSVEDARQQKSTRQQNLRRFEHVITLKQRVL
ncbi:unnamed protein product, partial [Mesorhabditis belari]|uniref:G-protein coupled receptors family 1 profile domain-containing protein n=1 Tax=Mesorhabditis belari TaxID=2138241 RepID=A0AAF3E930_9BILA